MAGLSDAPTLLVLACLNLNNLTTSISPSFVLIKDLGGHRDTNNFVGFPAHRQVYRLQQIIWSYRKRISDGQPDSHLKTVLRKGAASSKAIGSGDNKKLIGHDQNRAPLIRIGNV